MFPTEPPALSDLPPPRQAHAASSRPRRLLARDRDSGSKEPEIADVAAHARQALQHPEQSRRLRAAIDLLDKIPDGRALLKAAETAGVMVISDLSEEVLGYYAADSEPKLVGISDTGTLEEQVASLAHELFHVWQDHSGEWLRVNLAPENEVLVQRMLEAAAEAMAVHVCFELKEASHDGPWKSYRSKQARRDAPYADLAEAYEMRRRRSRGAEEMRPLKAIRAAFDQWFALPERRAAYDSKIVRMMERYQYAYVAAAGCPRVEPDSAWLSDIGVLPDGRNFIEGTGRLALVNDWYRSGMRDDLARRLDHANGMINAGGDPDSCPVGEDGAPVTARDFLIFPANQPKPGSKPPPAGPSRRAQDLAKDAPQP